MLSGIRISKRQCRYQCSTLGARAKYHQRGEGRACNTGLASQRESEERAKSVCKGHGLRNVMYIRRDLVQALGGLPVAATMILRP